MRGYLIENGWINYATGCPCTGLAKYYKHLNFAEYRIITKTGFGIIKKGGVEIFRTKQVEDFISKMEEFKLTK